MNNIKNDFNFRISGISVVFFVALIVFIVLWMMRTENDRLVITTEPVNPFPRGSAKNRINHFTFAEGSFTIPRDIWISSSHGTVKGMPMDAMHHLFLQEANTSDELARKTKESLLPWGLFRRVEGSKSLLLMEYF